MARWLTHQRWRTPRRARRSLGSANPLLRLLFRTPLKRSLGRQLALLRFTGRRSGRTYCFPVGVLSVRGRRIITSRRSWQSNFNGGMDCDALLDGGWRRVRAERVPDVDETADLFSELIETFGRANGAAPPRPPRQRRPGADARGARRRRTPHQALDHPHRRRRVRTTSSGHRRVVRLAHETTISRCRSSAVAVLPWGSSRGEPFDPPFGGQAISPSHASSPTAGCPTDQQRR